MKDKFMTHGRRIMLFILCLFTLLAIIPTTALAWTSTEGEKCKSYYENQNCNRDGEYDFYFRCFFCKSIHFHTLLS